MPRPSYPLFEHLARLDVVAAVPYDLEYQRRWDLDTRQPRAVAVAQNTGAARGQPEQSHRVVSHPKGAGLDHDNSRATCCRPSRRSRWGLFPVSIASSTPGRVRIDARDRPAPLRPRPRRRRRRRPPRSARCRCGRSTTRRWSPGRSATPSRRPVGDPHAPSPAATALGPLPTWIACTTVPVRGSMRVTVPASSLATQTAPAPAAIAVGFAPRGSIDVTLARPGRSGRPSRSTPEATHTARAHGDRTRGVATSIRCDDRLAPG